MLEINSNFVRKHCTAKKESPNILIDLYDAHASSTVVVFPVLDRLTDEICDCLEAFVKLITSNPDYVRSLSDKATLYDHFKYDDDC